jgi:hypothetical protein
VEKKFIVGLLTQGVQSTNYKQSFCPLTVQKALSEPGMET